MLCVFHNKIGEDSFCFHKISSRGKWWEEVQCNDYQHLIIYARKKGQTINSKEKQHFVLEPSTTVQEVVIFLKECNKAGYKLLGITQCGCGRKLPNTSNASRFLNRCIKEV